VPPSLLLTLKVPRQCRLILLRGDSTASYPRLAALPTTRAWQHGRQDEAGGGRVKDVQLLRKLCGVAAENPSAKLGRKMIRERWDRRERKGGCVAGIWVWASKGICVTPEAHHPVKYHWWSTVHGHRHNRPNTRAEHQQPGPPGNINERGNRLSAAGHDQA
jgi:hypothetical protein